MNVTSAFILGIATPFFLGGIGLALWRHSSEPLIGVVLAGLLFFVAMKMLD